MRWTWLRLITLIVVPIVGLAAGLGLWLQGGRYASTENAYVKADIVKIAPEVTGAVSEVHIRDHGTVERGDVLLKIDPEPFALALAQAEAELDAARQAVATLKATYSEARSALTEAENQAAYHLQKAKRHEALAKRGVISASKLDDTEYSAHTARDKVAMARQHIQRTLAALGGTPDGRIDAHPLVRAKRAAVDRAKLDLARTTIRAPVDGRAVNVTLQPGEQVKASTPLFAIISSARPWVEANFKETDLTFVSAGQKATVILDIYPHVTWQAEVTSISPATGAQFAILPPQNASGNWVKVVQRLPIRVRLLRQPGEPALRAGMTATVWIDTKRQRQLSDLFGKSIFGFGIATAEVEPTAVK